MISLVTFLMFVTSQIQKKKKNKKDLWKMVRDRKCIQNLSFSTGVWECQNKKPGLNKNADFLSSKSDFWIFYVQMQTFPGNELSKFPTFSHHCKTLTQQDYCDPQYGTLLHSDCTGTYTDVEVLLLWSSSTVTVAYPRRYSNRVAV